MTHADTATTRPPLPAGQRSDAGTIRLTSRDITGLVLCGEQYGAPYDLLAAYLDVREDRLRAITARWRAAGYAATGRLGPGPAWCWLTRPGLAATGVGSRGPGADDGWHTARRPRRPPVPRSRGRVAGWRGQSRTKGPDTGGTQNDGDTATTSPVLPTTPVPLPPGWASPLV